MPKDTRGQITKREPARANRFGCLQYGAVLVKISEATCEFEQVVAQVVWPVLGGDCFKDKAEIQEMFGQVQFLI